MTKIIYQIQISLNYFKSKIWRRLLIPSDLLLSDFHKIIQTSMGWKNSHLHHFIKNQTFYSERLYDDDLWDDFDNVDYRKIKISDLLKEENEKIIYEYDFGDSWNHDIILEKILTRDNQLKYPICLSGKMNCPPEDCGGIGGYSEMLEILKQPDHEEYESYIEWLGGEFDPEYFNMNEVNEMLKPKDYGLFDLWNENNNNVFSKGQKLNMIDELYIDKIMNDQNKQEIPEFEGYSPDEMQFILYETFENNSPIQLNKLTESDYKKIPILNQIKYLAELIHKHGELTLTAKGYLPPKIVTDVYEQGFMKDHFIESGISKLKKELDSDTIILPNVLLNIGGIIKKRNNKLSLTKNGEKILTDNHKLLRHIFSVFGSKFNWGYFDRYSNDIIGQFGFGFTLILLSKYGGTKQLDTFYADKYFKAFPMLIDHSNKPTYGTSESNASYCYSFRTFDRFLDYFGLIKIEKAKKWDTDKFISKTELFDKLIFRIPHNPGYTA